MTGPHDALSTPAGPVRLRPETPQDERFVLFLLRSYVSRMTAEVALTEAMLDQLVAHQHRSRTESYRTQFPHARYQIAERDDAPVARLVENDEADGVYIVDIAVAPRHQRAGIASALLSGVQARQASLGRGVHAKVSMANEPSCKLFRQLGFIESGSAEAANLDFVWAAPGPVKVSSR